MCVNTLVIICLLLFVLLSDRAWKNDKSVVMSTLSIPNCFSKAIFQLKREWMPDSRPEVVNI